ncbi:MAG: hypothetical protein PUE18_04985 [Firmicutes bacterium]|nr:hypothetical protein [Bacillota bacterium]
MLYSYIVDLLQGTIEVDVIKVGMNGHIAKPIRADEFLSALDSFLNR